MNSSEAQSQPNVEEVIVPAETNPAVPPIDYKTIKEAVLQLYSPFELAGPDYNPHLVITESDGQLRVQLKRSPQVPLDRVTNPDLTNIPKKELIFLLRADRISDQAQLLELRQMLSEVVGIAVVLGTTSARNRENQITAEGRLQLERKNLYLQGLVERYVFECVSAVLKAVNHQPVNFEDFSFPDSNSNLDLELNPELHLALVQVGLAKFLNNDLDSQKIPYTLFQRLDASTINQLNKVITAILLQMPSRLSSSSNGLIDSFSIDSLVAPPETLTKGVEKMNTWSSFGFDRGHLRYLLGYSQDGTVDNSNMNMRFSGLWNESQQMDPKQKENAVKDRINHYRTASDLRLPITIQGTSVTIYVPCSDLIDANFSPELGVDESSFLKSIEDHISEKVTALSVKMVEAIENLTTQMNSFTLSADSVGLGGVVSQRGLQNVDSVFQHETTPKLQRWFGSNDKVDGFHINGSEVANYAQLILLIVMLGMVFKDYGVTVKSLIDKPLSFKQQYPHKEALPNLKEILSRNSGKFSIISKKDNDSDIEAFYEFGKNLKG